MLVDHCLSICQRLMELMSFSGRKKKQTSDEGLLAGFHQSDPEQNSEFTPPAEEEIELCCIWATEIYTPAHTESLTEALRNFDQQTQSTTFGSEDLVSWFRGTQRHLNGGLAINLGIWAPKGRTSPPVFNTRTVGLPDSVEYANGMMFSVSQTLICIVVRFVFNKEMSKSYDAALKLDRETFFTQTPRGSQINLPMIQKRDDIWRLRSELSDLAETWFRENIPGVFSSGMDECGIPTCELVTFREAVPFPAADKSIPPLYLGLLGVNHDWDTWKCSNMPGLKFGFHDPPGRGPRNHATLAVNLKDWREVDPNRDSRDAKSSLLSYVSLPIPELMSIWTVVPLLQGFADKLVRIQNITVGGADKRRKQIDVLRQLTDHVSSLADISAVSADLEANDTERYRPLFLGAAFVPNRPEQYQGGTTLDAVLWGSIYERAKWLSSTDHNIRDRLSQIGALVGAQENVRLQRKVSILTWVILIVTVLALGTTIFEPLLRGWLTTIAAQVTDQLLNAWDSLPWRAH